MKTKHILLTILCIGMFSTAEAQFLKKLKKKAEEAAERTILRKTDEVVSEKTEKTIDDATTPKDKSDKKAEDTKKVAKKVDTKKVNNDNAQVTSESSEADIHVQSSVQPGVTQIGGSVTFTIAVNNKGPATSQDIVSKIIIPSSYAITNMSVSQGAYNQTSKLWNVGTLEAWKRAVMTVTVTVLNDANLMTTAELISCSTKDPDSTPNNGIDTNGNGLIVDDRDDEDDADGQDVIVEKSSITSNNSNNDGHSNSKESENGDEIDNPKNKKLPIKGIPKKYLVFDTDVKLELSQGDDLQFYSFDFNTMAMRIDYHSKGKNPDPVYFDKDGYIYSGEKGQYYKIHFASFTSSMVGMAMAFAPQIDLNNKYAEEWRETIYTIYYNSQSIVIPPDRYPVLEWAFMYHPTWFDGAEGVAKEIINCRGSSNCKRYIVMSGDGTGTYIVFDSEDRLIEISNPDGAKAIYTYEECTVNLPPAKQM